jgi:hypothetical protein
MKKETLTTMNLKQTITNKGGCIMNNSKEKTMKLAMLVMSIIVLMCIIPSFAGAGGGGSKNPQPPYPTPDLNPCMNGLNSALDSGLTFYSYGRYTSGHKKRYSHGFKCTWKDGRDVAQSGDISDTGYSLIKFYVTTSTWKTLTFWVKGDTQKGRDAFRFWVRDPGETSYDKNFTRLSGRFDWTQVRYNLRPGTTKIVLWYTKDSSGDGGSEDTIWIDSVRVE